ncbi:MAG TPA: maleylpyruvate isomerase family mycothiol-dependent enzyme [Acidimicrobiales bacterium]|nr:maleylpyruvate isomerase family mycothiol-dependent enzyme [Acidimicrobiales bacterium]
MTLPRTEVTSGLVTELESFGDLIRPLDAESWAAPTRCEGWAVCDVAAHVVGSIADVVSGQMEGLGSPEVTAREVAERKGRTSGELADELDSVTKQAADLAAVFDDTTWELAAPGGYDGTLGQGVEALWFDTYLHADDIRAALGRPSLRGTGLRASVHHVAFELGKLGWGPATLAFDGVEEVEVNAGGATHSGDALQFVLVATGRADPAALGPEGPIDIYA